MSSWEGVDDTTAKYRKTLLDRAKKRTGRPLGERTWVVDGDPKLHDEYPKYVVTLPHGAKRYTCSCREHEHGEHRQFCSHVLFVVLARKGNGVKFQGTRVSPDEVPAFVEGSGASEEEARKALDDEFGTGWTDQRPPLPAWVKYLRPGQWKGLQEILALYEAGKTVVFVDAPTGAGKTLLGELVARKVSPSRMVYTCSTKQLQEQFLHDFPYSTVIMGRSNYPTADNPDRYPYLSAEVCDAHKAILPACDRCNDWMRRTKSLDLTGEEKLHCSLCHPVFDCPYRQAKRVAMVSRVAVANIPYYLSLTNYQDQFRNEPLVIIDEADVIGVELIRHVEFTISKARLAKYGLHQPEKKTVRTSWVEWVRDQAVPALVEELSSYGEYPSLSLKAKKEHQSLESMIATLQHLGGWNQKTQSWGEDHLDGWIYTDYERGNVTLKPIREKPHAREKLWDHAQKWLLMSASIGSAEQMAYDLDLEDDEWGYVEVASSFPPERRPIYVEPTASMTYKNKDTSWPKMARKIADIIEEYPNERILIHTVSYAFTEYLQQRMKANGRAITYRNARERVQALNRFKKSERGIMLAPSFERGIDLPYDECRVVIIPKIPYPALKDKQVNARLYQPGGKGWYILETARSLIQMTGRAMRFEDDECEIYLLDTQFTEQIWKRYRHMLPGWWKAAVRMEGSQGRRSPTS